jgi:hypothetical protein
VCSVDHVSHNPLVPCSTHGGPPNSVVIQRVSVELALFICAAKLRPTGPRTSPKCFLALLWYDGSILDAIHYVIQKGGCYYENRLNFPIH